MMYTLTSFERALMRHRGLSEAAEVVVAGLIAGECSLRYHAALLERVERAEPGTLERLGYDKPTGPAARRRFPHRVAAYYDKWEIQGRVDYEYHTNWEENVFGHQLQSIYPDLMPEAEAASVYASIPSGLHYRLNGKIVMKDAA